MPLSERDYAKEPLPAERIEYEKARNLAEGLEDMQAILTADGYEFERKESYRFGWWDVLFWFVVLVGARGCTG
jgi:hypothetical protein